MAWGEPIPFGSYYPDMPRKAASPRAAATHDWYLQEWMRSLHVTQAGLGKLTGWSKATVNDIYHGKTSYYRDIVNEIAKALHLQPYELFMPPDLAHAIRQQQAASLTIVRAAHLDEPNDNLTPTPKPTPVKKFG